MPTPRFFFACIFLMLFLPPVSTAQGFPWESTYLKAVEYQSNGVVLYNGTDNAMRIRITKQSGELVQEKICDPKGQTQFRFLVEEVTEAYVNQLLVSVYYDVECYARDMQRIKNIAQQRYDRAVEKRQAQMTFRSIFSFGQLFDEDSWVYKAGNLGNTAMDLYDSYEDYKNNGITSGIIKFAEGKAQEWELQKMTRSDRAGTAINNLIGLKGLMEKDIKFQTADLQAAAILALDFVSDENLYSYHFSYDDFLNIIDPDGDGITNLFDDCDNVAGTEKYGGCTKEIVTQRRKAKFRARRKLARYSYPNFSLSAHYFTADFPNSANALRDEELYEASGFDISLGLPIYRHRWFGAVRGGLWIGGSARLSNFSANDISDDDKINIIDETYYNAEVSYGLLIGQSSPVRLMIKPVYGKMISVKVTAGDFMINGEEAPKDYFIPENEDTDVSYYGFDFRLLIGGAAEFTRTSRGFSASIPISLNFGMRYYDNTFPAITNDRLTNGLNINGAPFAYPSTLRDMRFGLSLHF